MEPIRASRRISPGQLGAALALFIALTVGMNPSLAFHPGRLYAAPSGDFAFGYWNTWWTARAFSLHSDPFFTRMVFHPGGISLLWHDLPILATGAAAPFVWAFSTAVAYNLLFLSTFVLAALGAYLLARWCTGSHLAGLGAGIVYSFAPIHTFTYVNQSNSQIEWLPFLVLALLKLSEEGRLRHGLLAGVWLGFTLLCNLYYGVYSTLLVAAFGVFWLFRPGPRRVSRRALLVGLGACAGTALLLNIFRLIPMLAEKFSGGVETGVTTRTYADLLGLKIRLEADGSFNIIGWPSILGWSVLLGAVLATVKGGWQRTRLWWLLALGFFVLALGNSLSVAGREYPLPMPADLLHRLPVLSTLRGYQRALIVVVLALALLFAELLRRLHEKNTRGGRALAWTALALVTAEFRAPPRQPWPDPVSAFYHELAREPGQAAVLAIPFDPDASARSMVRPMFLQTVHQKPLISGFYARRDPRQRKRLEESQFLAALMAADLEHLTRPIPLPDAEAVSRYRRELSDLGVGTVIFQPQLVRRSGDVGEARSKRVMEIRTDLLLPPIWWGPAAGELLHPPPPEVFPFVASARLQWMDPSVEPFLKAVLGEPERKLEDGAWVWRLKNGAPVPRRDR